MCALNTPPSPFQLYLAKAKQILGWKRKRRHTETGLLMAYLSILAMKTCRATLHQSPGPSSAVWVTSSKHWVCNSRDVVITRCLTTSQNLPPLTCVRCCWTRAFYTFLYAYVWLLSKCLFKIFKRQSTHMTYVWHTSILRRSFFCPCWLFRLSTSESLTVAQ